MLQTAPLPQGAAETPNAKPTRIRFDPSTGFQQDLKERVDRYFVETGLRPRGSAALYRKAAIMLVWLAASYGVLVFLPMPWWGAVLAGISLAFALAAVGFNVQHDGGHRAFSDNPALNKLAAASLDLIGGSSYIWNYKHNTLHHTYANITGHDDDIDLGMLGRLSPHQKHFWFHRFQHIYLWFLYGFLTFKWLLVTDFVRALSGRINQHRFPRPKGWDLALFVGGKTLLIALAFVIPALHHPLPIVVAFFVGVSFLESLIISVVFQMAHTVEEADFPMPEGMPPERIHNEWMIHQIETTVDFARHSRLLSWYIGGLNFQVEHHLFPRIAHIHYPALARIVEETCREHGVRYTAHTSLWNSLRSHYRWLHEMGRPPVAA
jgi:linoleoyl-CoA desaturase